MKEHGSRMMDSEAQSEVPCVIVCTTCSYSASEDTDSITTFLGFLDFLLHQPRVTDVPRLFRNSGVHKISQ